MVFLVSLFHRHRAHEHYSKSIGISQRPETHLKMFMGMVERENLEEIQVISSE